MNLPSWWNKEGQRQNRRSATQERKRAQQIGGRVQPGSGSSWRAPQDIRSDEFLEQVKYTDSRSSTITTTLWRRLREDANRAGLEPRYVMDFVKEGIRLVVTEEELPPQ